MTDLEPMPLLLQEQEQDVAVAFGWHYDAERAVFVGPPMRITVDAPGGVSSLEFGNLLVGLEELWRSCNDEDDDGATLRIVELGTGSLWARFKAECRKSPLASFAAFVAILNSSPAGTEPPPPPIPYIQQATPERFQEAHYTILRKGGTVEIHMEVGSRDTPSTTEVEDPGPIILPFVDEPPKNVEEPKAKPDKDSEPDK